MLPRMSELYESSAKMYINMANENSCVHFGTFSVPNSSNGISVKMVSECGIDLKKHRKNKSCLSSLFLRASFYKTQADSNRG